MDTKTKDKSCARISLEVALEPAVAFDLVVRELADALARAGIEFEPGPNGRWFRTGLKWAAWQHGNQANKSKCAGARRIGSRINSARSSYGLRNLRAERESRLSIGGGAA